MWNCRSWLECNPWESEHGASRLALDFRDYYWDHAICWLDDRRIAVGGIGDDDERMVDGVRLYAADDGMPGKYWNRARELAVFSGPSGEFFSDGLRLFSSDEVGVSVWDVTAGARTGMIPGFHPSRQHARHRELVELSGTVLHRWKY